MVKFVCKTFVCKTVMHAPYYYFSYVGLPILLYVASCVANT